MILSFLPRATVALASFACCAAYLLFGTKLLAECTPFSQQSPQVEQKSEAPPLVEGAKSVVPSAPAGAPKAQPGAATTGSPGETSNLGVQKKKDSQAGSRLGVWARGLVEIFKIVVSWPFVVAALLFYLVFFRSAPSRVAIILKPFRSLKLFGTEFVLSEEAGADAEQAIETYRKQVKRKFDSLVEVHDIRSKLEAVIGELQPLIESRKKIKDLRCTLHVPDILFADTLYQLLDYYPLGGGRGRAFSSRFGMIGLCWRSRKDQIKGEVPVKQGELIGRWGMTEEEAKKSGSGRQSFLALVLKDDSDTSLGVFYMDAPESNAFGADTGDEEFRERLRARARQASKDKGLIASLEKLRDDLKERRPLIRIHEQ